MKNKIKGWLRDMINLGTIESVSDDVNVDIAKAYYQKYQDDLKRQQKEYIKTICNEIKALSRCGRKSIKTKTLSTEFMTYEFMMELKEYFEKRGFQVKEEINNSGVLTSWLRISWE